MENNNIDTLLGKIIANGSLLASLVRVLPVEALRALEPELQRDVDFGKDFFVAQSCSDETIASFEFQAQANLDLVKKALSSKEALSSTDGYLQWMREQIGPNQKE